jgi:hypothetical protein
MRKRLEAVVGDKRFDRVEQAASSVVTAAALGPTGRGRTNGTKDVVEGHRRESPLGRCYGRVGLS